MSATSGRRVGLPSEVCCGCTADRIRPGVHRRAGRDCATRRIAALGMVGDRIYVDHGLTRTNRDRPGLCEALAACRTGDTLVVTKLDRLAASCPMRERSPRTSPDGRSASAWAARYTTRPTRSAACCSTCSPWRPNLRPTSFDRACARACGWRRRRATCGQAAHAQSTPGDTLGHTLLRSGEYATAELGDLFSVARSTVYRALAAASRPGSPPNRRPPARLGAASCARPRSLRQRTQRPPRRTGHDTAHPAACHPGIAAELSARSLRPERAMTALGERRIQTLRAGHHASQAVPPPEQCSTGRFCHAVCYYGQVGA